MARHVKNIIEGPVDVFSSERFNFRDYAVYIDPEWVEQSGKSLERQWRIRVINYRTGRYEPDRYVKIEKPYPTYRELILKATGRKRLYRGLLSW